MPKTEDGEFELILGNKQLLSLFFVALVLLGIFFTAGYIVGRSSAATHTPDVAVTKPAVQNPPPMQHSPDAPTPAPVTPEAKPPDPGTTDGGGAATPPSQAQPDAPVVTPPAPAKPEPKEDKTLPAAVTDPAAGQTFLQVVAVGRPDAELISETLAKRGFKAVIAPGPKDKDNVFRVLVGPLKDAAEMARIRTGLEAAGFKNPVVRKY